MGRGFALRCPQCGAPTLFGGYLRVSGSCAVCALDFTGHRADDAPPYITIMIVGHVAIPLALAMKQVFDPSLAVQFAIWLPAMLIATAWLLPRSKGAMIGLQWANRMHGFGDDDDDPALPDYSPNS